MKKFPIVFFVLLLCVAVRAQVYDYEYHDRNFFGLATDTVSSDEDSVFVAVDSVSVDVLPFAHPMPPMEQSEPVEAVAPRKSVAAAAACPIDSILGYDEEGKFTTLTEYAYDAAGRTTATVKWQWTDGNKKGISKNEQQYDASGRVILTANWVWNDAADTWKGTTKTESAYDESGRKTVDMSWTWDDETNDWKGVTKNEYTFNPAGKYTEWVVYTWADGDWTGKTRTTYSYNEAGKQLETVEYTYDAVNKTWVGVTKSEYTYDAAGHNLLALSSSWNAESGKWIPTSKYEYAYDEAGNQTLDSYYTAYDAVNDTWTGSYKKIYTYNSAKKKLLDEQYTWDAKTGTWKGSAKTEYEYNAANKTTLTLKYKWSNGDWVNNSKTVQEYDEKNRETDKAVYSWKNDAWTGSSRTSTTYNAAGKKETVITYKWTDGDWVNNALTGYSYDGSLTTEEYKQTWNGTEWVNTTRTTYTYTAAKKAETTYTYTWDGADWQYATRILYTYNAKGSLIITHNASFVDGKWKMTSMKREDFDFDEAGHTILDATYTCSDDSIWKGVNKDEWTYNASGTLIYRAAYKYGADDWVPDYKVEWEYDEAGRRLNEQRLNYNNGNWYPNYWYIYQYDDKGREKMSSMYTGSGMDWVGSYKTERTYDENGQVANEISYTWLKEEGDWAGLFRYTHVYDASKREIEYIVERYKESEWVNDTRNVYDFNAKGLQTINNKYVWFNEEWTYSERSEKEFDAADNKVRTELAATYESGTLLTYELMKYYYACDPKYYTVRFFDYNGTPLQEESLLEGTMPEYKGTALTREATAAYTYTFKGWKPAIAIVTEAADYVADYDSVAVTYTVRFLDYDGAELQKGDVSYGTTPEYTGETPAREANDYYTYTFKGWKPTVVSVTEAADYVADYDSTAITYTVRFLNYDGEELQKEELTYNETPEYKGGVPAREANNYYTYTFKSWKPEIAVVTEAADYVADYDSTAITYTVRFLDYNGEELQKEELSYNETPEYKGETPVRDATEYYTYTFKGWKPAISVVSAAADYVADYDSVAVTYTVRFLDYNGAELQKGDVSYGTVPEYTGETPVREATDTYTYTFKGWKPEVVSVTEAADYVADYDSTAITFTVRFLNYDGTPLQELHLALGEMPEYEGETPVRETDDEYYYIFMGWTPAVKAVTGDADYKAKYESVSVTTLFFTISFYDYDNTPLGNAKIKYGEMPVYEGETPTRLSTDEYDYEFSGWSPELQPVTGIASYTATYNAIPKTPTALDTPVENERQVTKTVKNGVLYVIIDGVMYDAMGNKIGY